VAQSRRLKPTGLVGAGLVGALAAWTAVNRAAVRRLANRPDPVDPAELAMPADLTEHTLTMSDGWRLRVAERGPQSGRPVLLLHGITLGVAVWPYQFAALPEEGLRVVAIDLRGHGLSGGAVAGEETGTGSPRHTLDRMAADVAEVMESLDLDKVVIVGHSMGGMVALRLLGSDPALAAGRGRAAGLVLAGTTSQPATGRGLPGLSEALALAQPLVSSASGLAARLPGPTLPANDLGYLIAGLTFGEEWSSQKVAFTGKLTAETPVRVSAGLMLEILRFDAHRVLPGIGLPTTVVVGDQDVMTPPPHARYLASHIDGAELVVLPGCGHMIMLERPEELNRLIAKRAGL
jgi:pimeloyl-ACP methyl ester carboxylesterase